MIDSVQQCPKCKKLKRLTALFVLLGICIQYLLSYNWTIADIIFQEFHTAKEIGHARVSVFNASKAVIDVSPIVMQLIPPGTDKAVALQHLQSAFALKDVSRTYMSTTERKKYDEIYCGSKASNRLLLLVGMLKEGEYRLCLFVRGDSVERIDAKYAPLL